MNTPDYRILDSLSSSIAVIDREGTIVFANKTWSEFGKVNGARSDFLGKPYLAYCGEEDTQPDKVSLGIQSVLNRSIPSFSYEYPCHSPVEQRWFRMIVTPHDADDGQGLLSHMKTSRSASVPNIMPCSATSSFRLSSIMSMQALSVSIFRGLRRISRNCGPGTSGPYTNIFKAIPVS
ncbi:hypothetical protein B9H02_11325 [Prosthecochloris sp. HL-130-GSB]|nr:hypothetical protein B9H02_11325 [Prosthecochloris sp. HL-130-GSB]